MDKKEQIQKAVNFIDKNLCEDIKLNDIAKQSFFSEFHFHRLFSKAMGTSVMGYLREKRLANAAEELKESDEKITNIAFKYQFSSEESFSRSFKRVYGISPRDFRATSGLVAINRKIRASAEIKCNKSLNLSVKCMAA